MDVAEVKMQMEKFLAEREDNHEFCHRSYFKESASIARTDCNDRVDRATKTFAEVVKGSLTAAFGMVALTAGVNMLTGTIAPINTAVQTQLGVQVADGLSDVTFTAEYGELLG